MSNRTGAERYLTGRLASPDYRAAYNRASVPTPFLSLADDPSIDRAFWWFDDDRNPWALVRRTDGTIDLIGFCRTDPDRR